MQLSLSNEKVINVKPFLKWAGGKTQLLEDLNIRLPKVITEGGIIESYIEPFVGGGAMFFFLKKTIQLKSHVYSILTNS